MNYEVLENAGELEFDLTGRLLDLHAIGILHINMQDIIDKVVFALLSQEGAVEPTWRRSRYLPTRQSTPLPRIVKGVPKQVDIGSFKEILDFWIAPVIADPTVIAILQNLAANIIWAIGTSGIRGITHSPNGSAPDNFLFRRARNDPFEIGPNLREVLLVLAEQNNSRPSRIRLSRRNGPESITIEIKTE